MTAKAIDPRNFASPGRRCEASAALSVIHSTGCMLPNFEHAKLGLEGIVPKRIDLLGFYAASARHGGRAGRSIS